MQSGKADQAGKQKEDKTKTWHNWNVGETMLEFVEAPEAPEVQQIRPEKVSLYEAASGRYPCLVFGFERATFWMEAEVYKKADISLCSLSSFPYPYPEDLPKGSRRIPEHNIMLEVNAIGWEDIFDVDGCSSIEGLAKWLLTEGIAPGQPFRVDMTVTYSRGSRWDTEPETNYEWDIIELEYWEPERVMRAWEDWMQEWRKAFFI